MALKSGRVGIHPSLVDPITGMLLIDIPSDLSDLEDVGISEPSNGQVLKYNSTSGKWENSTDASGAQIDDSTTAIDKVWSSSKTSTELGKKLSYTDNAILGAKNLLPNNAVSQTIDGITFTVNDDGSITVNGTAGSTSNPAISGLSILYLKKGEYILSGCPSGGSSGTYNILLVTKNDNIWYLDVGEGIKINVTEDTYCDVYYARVIANTTVSNLTFKPMVRLASDSDNTYQPYAMTNRELTDAVADISTVITGNAAISSSYFDTTDSSNYCKYRKYGNVVWVHFQATTNTDIANGNIYLANGLPSVSTDQMVGHAYDITNGTSTPTLAGQIRMSSTYINYPFNGAIASGTKLRMIFTYICD